MLVLKMKQDSEDEEDEEDDLPMPKSVGDDVRSLILKNPQSAIASPKLK
jgi:hypothetical protein